MVNCWVSHWRLVRLVWCPMETLVMPYGFFFLFQDDITTSPAVLGQGGQNLKSHLPLVTWQEAPSLHKLNAEWPLLHGLVCQGLKAANIRCKRCDTWILNRNWLLNNWQGCSSQPQGFLEEFVVSDSINKHQHQLDTNRFYQHWFSSFSATKLE